MAANTQEMEDVLSALVTTVWNTATGSAVLLYDNVPNSGAPPKDAAVWGRLHIREQVGTRASLGNVNAKHRTSGTLFLQVFVRKDTGKAVINPIATAVKETLEDATPAQLGNIWLRDTVSKSVGASDETYFQVNVETAFTYDRNT
jgi:hypothetical protein